MGMAMHGEQALTGMLLMQWFEELFGDLETELRKLRTELRQPAQSLGHHSV